ncbi:MAG: TM2 domain-containing protein [Terracidiphilus sp.]
MASGIPVMNTTAMFYEQYESVRRDEVVGILLALFLGTFGIHHFYLRRTGLGILYCCFFWSGIPSILGFIECFFMAGRVREFNAIQAAGIAAALGMPGPPGWGWMAGAPAPVPPAPLVNPATTLPLQGAQVTCAKCGGKNVAGARFCSGCGAVLQ